MDETSRPNPAQASGRKLPAVSPKPGELDLRTAYVTLLKAYERRLRIQRLNRNEQGMKWSEESAR